MKTLIATLAVLGAVLAAPAQSALYNITLSWVHSPSWDTNSVYVVKQSAQNGPFTPVASTTNNTVMLLNVLGQQLRYHVVMTNLWGESVPSNELKFPPFPLAPSTLTAPVVTKQ